MEKKRINQKEPKTKFEIEKRKTGRKWIVQKLKYKFKKKSKLPEK